MHMSYHVFTTNMKKIDFWNEDSYTTFDGIQNFIYGLLP